MANLSATELWDAATSALQGQGFEPELSRKITEEFVVAEFLGTKTHGVGKIISLNLGDPSAQATFTKVGSLISVDGQRQNGFILFQQLSEQLKETCSRDGIAIAFARNFSRYSSLYPYTTNVADGGYVAVLLNSAGPAAVAPFGSIDPITGTNPICFSFPTSQGVQTFDFATSDVVWGAIRQASLENEALPYGSFLNHAGEITTKPSDANAVKAFGGKKGSAFNLAIEILTGALSGGRVGVACESEYDCGAMFMAIDPDRSGTSLEALKADIDALLDSIRASRPMNASDPVRVPGDRGRNALKVASIELEMIEVSDSILQMLSRMSSGENISELASNPLFN